MSDETVTSAQFSKLADARSKTYGFLSVIYIQRPSEDFLHKMLDPSFQSFLTSLMMKKDIPKEMMEGLKIVENFINKSRKSPLKEVREKLSVEFTRLFRGVKRFYGPPPPYESVYVEEKGRIMGESTVKVSKEYARAGVSIPNQYKGEPPDHISFELDFTRYLCSREASAWKKNNLSEALKFLEEQKKFINEHLARWVPNFCGKVVKEAKIEFYQGIAKITKGFVRLDFDQIDAFIDMAKRTMRKQVSAVHRNKHLLSLQ